MGMYTELQGAVIFKSEEIAKSFAYGKELTESWNHWELIHNIVPDDKVKEFVGWSRSSWIPNGDIYSQEGCVVKFHTELKNYDSTIEKFLELLPVIADQWTLETKYEELYHWTLHQNNKEPRFVNGDNIHQMDYPFNKESYEKYPDFDVFDLSNL